MKTIEEKINEASKIAVDEVNNPLYHPLKKDFDEFFKMGAHYVLDELTPTMDQMRKSLMDAKLMLEHQGLEWTDTYKEIKSVLQNETAKNTDRILDGSLTGDESRDVIVQQWLRLTEELFKKIK